MEWIEIDKQLPKDGDVVLVYDMAFGRSVAEYKNGEFIFYFTDWKIFFEHVTHWTYLPDVPKEEQDNDKYSVYITDNLVYDKFIVVIGNDVFGISQDKMAVDDTGIYYGTKKSCSGLLENAIKLKELKPYIKEKVERIIKSYGIKNV